MHSWWRWAAVLSGVAVLATLPVAIGHLPAGDGQTASAEALLARIHDSGSTPYAGYAESTGGLNLPVTDELSSVVELLGGHTQMRVWWRSAQDWRVDDITPVGEEGVHRNGDLTWTWDFEDNRARIAEPVDGTTVRLPQPVDTLPPELGRRLLSEARPSEVSVLSSRRVAGRAADGVRLVPQDRRSSVARVDVWADRSSGVPLRVEVFGAGAAYPAMSATFLDFTATPPDSQLTAFEPPPLARIRSFPDFDPADLLARIPVAAPPGELVGMPRDDALVPYGAIGVYGRGVTRLVVSPLRRGQGDSLHEQLRLVPGVTESVAGVAVSVGPLGLLVTTPDGSGRSWLLAGTVTKPTLAAAAVALLKSQGRSL